MFCMYCGQKNEETSKFCIGCGKPLEESTPQVEPEPKAQPKPQHASVQETPQQQQFIKGCATQAWDDIKAAGKWFTRSILIALINIVPILNFCVSGYYYSLGEHSAYGCNQAFPTSIINGKNFKKGFFMLVVGFIATLAFALVFVGITSLFYLVFFPIGILLTIADLVFFILFGCFLNLMCQRCYMISFGAAFNLKKVWKAFTAQLGKLVAACLLPGLLTALIAVGIALLGFIISTALGATNIMTAVGTASNGGNPLGFMAAFAGISGVIMFIFGVVASIATIVGSQITVKAVGHYINRYAPDWVEEANAAASTVIYNSPTPQPQVTAPQPEPKADDISNRPVADVPKSAEETVQPQEESQIATEDATTILAEDRVLKLVGKRGKTYEITSFPSTLGKSTTADCQIINDSTISRIHARVHTYGEEQFVIEDLKATNKTYINGYVLEPEELVVINNGDIIKFGKTELTVQY